MRWTGLPDRRNDQIGPNVPKMDIFSDNLRHLVMIVLFWAVERFAPLQVYHSKFWFREHLADVYIVLEDAQHGISPLYLSGERITSAVFSFLY